MAGAGWALQRALYQVLVADAGLLAALGGPRVFDHVPRDAAFPYVVFGQSSLRDWSTGTDDGHEHAIALHVWSRGAGRKETQEIMAAIEAALGGAAPAVVGHRLINLRHETSDLRREGDGETRQGTVRFRAVTERI